MVGVVGSGVSCVWECGAMSAEYSLVLLHEGDGNWADAVEQRVRQAFKDIVQRDDFLTTLTSVRDIAVDTPSHVVVLCLASTTARSSERVHNELVAAHRGAFSVVPLLQPGQDASEAIPRLIQRLNALSWDDGPATALLLLRQFGLVESERKLFLSYRRAESSTLALQLRDSLSRRRYDVFLDRFSVPPGDDFQKRIDIELGDKAFVLLLESQSATSSAWVQHEVAYALSHHIAVLALTMPDTAVASMFESVDEALRHRLQRRDFENELVGSEGRLVEAAMNCILDKVEVLGARQLRRKRAQLLGATRDWLSRARFASEPIADWAVVATRADVAPRVIMVSARPPAADDLRTVDMLRQPIPNAIGAVVHDTVDQDVAGQGLISWIIAGRPLTTIQLARLPDTLGV